MPDARAEIIAALEAALIAADPERSTANAVRATSLPSSSEAIDIVGIGKAAVPMVRGAISALPGCMVRVFVLTKDDHGLGQTDPTWTVRYGAHPVLEQRNIDATNQLLAWLAAGDAAPLTLCLVSGGGSALLERPDDGISLHDFQAVTGLLLRAGADITELNTVRSCLSQVKGGGLRSFVRSPRCISLLLSDVLGNDPAVIASGPTVPTRFDPAEALAV
ncbi:MAG TPA: glycerate-2-kinase family protein, partial [Thermomicrobiales bacterium]|nr:glycerate-2-kinase family protein [Thermomicrobiales bacterium]